jgi:hypothetical protein
LADKPTFTESAKNSTSTHFERKLIVGKHDLRESTYVNNRTLMFNLPRDRHLKNSVGDQGIRHPTIHQQAVVQIPEPHHSIIPIRNQSCCTNPNPLLDRAMANHIQRTSTLFRYIGGQIHL